MRMTWGQLSNKLGMKTAAKRIPVLGQFELTARCNLKCRMCYVCQAINDKEAIAKEKTAEEWIRLAKEAYEAGMLYLLLTGGEVFLRKDFRLIYEELSQMGFVRSIYSNGTLITPEIAKWLGKLPPAQIDITLYGASPETYACICGDPGAFDRTIRGIKLLQEEGINVQLRTTVIKANRQDLAKLLELADAMGLELHFVNYISPRREGFGSCPEAERLSPKELIEYEIEVEKYYRDYDHKKRAEDTILNKYTLEDIYRLTPKPETGHPFHCSNGKNAFWITWDGRMIPCSLLEEPYEVPFEKGFMAAWNEMIKSCGKVQVCHTCSHCTLQDFCMTCPARLKCETGSFTKPSPYLCELAKERYQIYLKLKMGGVNV